MNLPPALAPWAPFLEEFPLEVAPALGEMARRLAQIIGPNGADADFDEGEMDGYDGLSRRGSPDRMLMSDWLLSLEAPDEWARRAAENELSFLQIARKIPRQSAAVAAIFDAGPSVLGAPRLGELAALLVLSRRARELGATLKWGIAQKPVGELWQGATPSGVLALIQARGAAPATVQDLDFWRESFADCEEIWLVGAREIETLAAPSEAILRFEDPFESGRGLDVKAARAGAIHRAHLPLPEDRICTRLLRNPFGAPEENGAQVRRVKPLYAPKSNLVWLNGHTLGAHTRKGGIAVFRVPSSPRGGVAKPKHYPLTTHAPHFIGEWNGAILSAAVTPEMLKIEVVGGKTQSVPGGFYSYGHLFDESETAPAKTPTAPPQLSAISSFPGSNFRPLLSCDGVIYQIRPQETPDSRQRGVLVPVLHDVVATGQFAGGMVALARTGGWENAPRIVRLQAKTEKSSGFELQSEDFFVDDFQCAFWGGALGMEEKAAGWGILALQIELGWRIFWSQGGDSRSSSIPVASGERVLGVIGWRAKWNSPALLVLSEDARILTLRGADWNFQIVSGEPILGATVSLLTPYVAWHTAREITVYSLSADAILARWEWEES